MKTCKCRFIHWAILILGAAFLICALLGMFFIPDFLGVKHAISFVHVASSLFLFAIASKLICGCCKDGQCNVDKKES